MFSRYSWLAGKSIVIGETAARAVVRNAINPAPHATESETDMETILIILLILLVGWASWHIREKRNKGGACCGEHEKTVKRVPAADRDRSHYRLKRTLTIGGMTCENCARRVENALNAVPGVWAKVDIAEKRAVVLLKEEIEDTALQKAVSSAGYTVLDIRDHGNRS